MGVRSAPKAGVLGARSGPVTGDAAHIVIWLSVLAACLGMLVTLITQAAKRRKRTK